VTESLSSGMPRVLHETSVHGMLTCMGPQAVLLYENGCPVKAASESEELLLGETEVHSSHSAN
jgi:hypothetical protein